MCHKSTTVCDMMQAVHIQLSIDTLKSAQISGYLLREASLKAQTGWLGQHPNRSAMRLIEPPLAPPLPRRGIRTPVLRVSNRQVSDAFFPARNEKRAVIDVIDRAHSSEGISWQVRDR